MKQNLIKAYQECRQYRGCYVVGDNAKGCLAQAKAVLVAREIGLEVKFEKEESYWLDYVGDMDTSETWHKRFESGTHEVLFGYIEDSCGNVLASLGGIVVSCDEDGREYLHSVELELMHEAVSELKQA